jgi:hypothetical protein
VAYSGTPKFLREIGHRADVILVRVGQHNSDQILATLLDEIKVGKDQFGSGIFVGAEGHA